MSNLWARNSTFRWPSDKPVWTYSAIAYTVAFMIGAQIFTYQSWTPLQQYWLPTYTSATIAPIFKITSSHYRLLAVYSPDGEARLPTNGEVEAGVTVLGHGLRIPLAVSESARRQGKRLAFVPSRLLSNEWLQEQLRDVVYGGSTLAQMAFWPVLSGFVMLFPALWVAVRQDKCNAEIRTYGRRLRGPELVSPVEFNRKLKSDGIGFDTLLPTSLRDGLLQRDRYATVRVPRSVESSGFMTTGDNGAGKTTLVRKILTQIHQRGETAVIYDPGFDYVGSFHKPEYGDVILNPLDARMPYWSPADEVTHPAEALTLAAALFPEKARDNPFFLEGTRKIFAQLLNLRPTNEQLLAWLSDETELEKRLKGTPAAALIYQAAGPQRGGMLASLSMVADSLQLLPKRNECSATWTAAEWAKQRSQWIFITSTAEIRESLRPLASMWLDMLILRLMHNGKPGARKVWLILDELASLHKLPQLPTALAETRKSNNPIVLCFQGRSQIEEIYGHQAEAMFSQPATKIFLKTSEPRAAQWVSDSIGNLELERLRESTTVSQAPNQPESRTSTVEREVTPLVMKEEIAGLEKLHGYLKHANLIVQIRIPYITIEKPEPDFVLRPARPLEPSQTQPEPPTSPEPPLAAPFQPPEPDDEWPEQEGIEPPDDTFFK